MLNIDKYIVKLNTDIAIKHKGNKHRISCELNNLFLQSDKLVFETLTFPNKIINNVEIIANNVEYVITVTINNNLYKFILPSDYPFKIPLSIHYNNNNYKNILSTNTPKIKYYLKKIYGLSCLCCSSLSCSNNWTPAISIASIINEINYNVKLKKDLLLYILCDYIKIKYGCSFAYFEYYLL